MKKEIFGTELTPQEQVDLIHRLKSFKETGEYIDQLKVELKHSDRENRKLRERVKELENQLKSETDSRIHWQKQAQRYQKYHKELNSALNKITKLEEENAHTLNEVTQINNLIKETRRNVAMRIIELETMNARYKEFLESIVKAWKNNTTAEGLRTYAEEVRGEVKKILEMS